MSSIVEFLKQKADIITDLLVGLGLIEINMSWAEIVAQYFNMEKLEGYSKIIAMVGGFVYFVFRTIVYARDAKGKKLDNEIKKQTLKDLKNEKDK